MISSLHTKYRPTKLDDVLGQAHVTRSLKHAIVTNRSRAFLFTGPSGTGKTTLARILASVFAGENRTLVNIEEVDGASKSGADDMRELITRTLYRAIGGSPTKFIIVDEAHRLSAAAWTVLLKPLEEPPAHVYYALCTTEAAKIPKAIITRCLRYDLKPVKEDLLLELLIRVVDEERLEISDEILEAIAENSNGSPRQALVYLEACLGCKSIGEVRTIIRSAGQSTEIVDLARWLVSGKAQSWAEAVKYIKALEGQDGESCRIVLTAYLTAVLLNSKNDKNAAKLLGMLECFSKPYNQSDKLAPLCLSVGMAIGLDQ